MKSAPGRSVTVMPAPAAMEEARSRRDWRSERSVGRLARSVGMGGREKSVGRGGREKSVGRPRSVKLWARL